jgi:hypothetical protein
MIMGAFITCCKDCPDRFPGCHGSCEKYITQKAEHDKRAAEYRKAHSVSSVDYQKFDGIMRAARRNGSRNKYRRGR